TRWAVRGGRFGAILGAVSRSGLAILNAMAPSPLVAVVCGSRSDLPTLRGCFEVLDAYGIDWEASVISAHRQPEALGRYVRESERAGARVYIAAAGLAAHLPGVLASL